jgi:hypothetical protein
MEDDKKNKNKNQKIGRRPTKKMEDELKKNRRQPEKQKTTQKKQKTTYKK